MSKAQRTTIQIGALEVEGFMLPDGSYRMSQTQAAEIVNLSERNAREFLQSKALKSLLGEGYTPAISEIEPDAQRGGSRIRALPLEVVSVYWLWQASRGSKPALTLCTALMTESLERRFDDAFGVSRSEPEYNARLADRLQGLERDLSALGDAYAEQDLARQERDRFYQRLVELGEDPYKLPDGTNQSTNGEATA